MKTVVEWEMRIPRADRKDPICVGWFGGQAKIKIYERKVPFWRRGDTPEGNKYVYLIETEILGGPEKSHRTRHWSLGDAQSSAEYKVLSDLKEYYYRLCDKMSQMRSIEELLIYNEQLPRADKKLKKKAK
jgi:hypothetical protein